jgi:hypothetical protein
MEPSAVQEALEATKLWGDGYQVHITGGEPFLNFPLLQHAVETAVHLKIPVYVETNAGWCVQEELMERRFKALRDAGMASILISCSPFHADTIPPAHTYAAIEKAMEIFGQRNVIVYLPEWLDLIGQFGVGEPVQLKKYLEAYGDSSSGRLFWGGYGLISGGRSGYRLGNLVERLPFTEFQKSNCKQEILYAHHSHFDLYGHFISGFCGGLRVGTWRQLPDLLREFSSGRYPPMIELLIHSGPYGLCDLAIKEYNFSPMEAGYAGKCHLCVDVRRHMVSQSHIEEFQPIDFYKHF